MKLDPPGLFYQLIFVYKLLVNKSKLRARRVIWPWTPLSIVPVLPLRLVCNSIIPSIIVSTSTYVYVPLSDTLEPIPRDIQSICIFMRAEAFLKCYPCHITCRQFSLNRSQLLTEDGVVIFYNVIGVFCNNITIICIIWATLYTIAQSFSSWCQQTAELFRLQNLTHGHCRHTLQTYCIQLQIIP